MQEPLEEDSVPRGLCVQGLSESTHTTLEMAWVEPSHSTAPGARQVCDSGQPSNKGESSSGAEEDMLVSQKKLTAQSLAMFRCSVKMTPLPVWEGSGELSLFEF